MHDNVGFRTEVSDVDTMIMLFVIIMFCRLGCSCLRAEKLSLCTPVQRL